MNSDPISDLNAKGNIDLKPELKTIKDWLNQNESGDWVEGVNKDFRFNLDGFKFTHGVQHIWGWAFHVSDKIQSVDIISLDLHGNIYFRKAQINKIREDVEAVFNCENARMSGFSFLGSAVSPMDSQAIEMVILFRFTHKKNRYISLMKSAHDYAPDKKIIVKNKIAKTHWNIKKGASLLKSGELQRLFFSVTRVFSRRIENSDILYNQCEATRKAKHYLANGAELIFDHVLGGGSNAYSKIRIDELVENAQGAVVISYSVKNLSFTLKVIDNDGVIEDFFIQDLIGCLQELSSYTKKIFINNLVSFPRPEALIEALIKVVGEHSVHLTVAFHEHYAICPSHFLLNAEGRFCNVPKTSVCQSCLLKNPYGFTSLAESQDVDVWREKWNRLFSKASQLLFFSEASLSLVARVFSELDQDKVTVLAHQVDLSDWSPIKPNFSDGLKIGVVGSLSHHKGSEIIQNLAREIEIRQLDIGIQIIGHIDGPSHALISSTGPYNHNQLPDLISESGANIFILPSIVPETFSYVTSELMELNLPIISFDFGAPAERLKDYSLGETIPLGSTSEMLDSVLAFYRKVKRIYTP